MTKKRLNSVQLEELLSRLKERPPTRRIHDPHRRGRIIPSKKLYRRKPRTPSGAFHFGEIVGAACLQVPASGSTCHANVCHAAL